MLDRREVQNGGQILRISADPCRPRHKSLFSAARPANRVPLYLDGADRDKLDPILDTCVASYINDVDEDGQVDFKGKAKAFTRTYDFLATILPYGVQEWEKLSIFMNFLIPKLPAPKSVQGSLSCWISVILFKVSLA
jgi:hypothetical protein